MPDPTRDPRDVVTHRIVSQFKRFPNIGLQPLNVDVLDARDASLARAIDHAVHRRWITLMVIIARVSSRHSQRLDANVGATLLVAIAQLMLFDRIPDHAVINCAVEWVRNNGNPKATGFVNAILRKVARLRGELIDAGVAGQSDHFLRGDGTAWKLTEPVFEDGTAQQTGFSKRAWSRLVDGLGEEVATNIAIGSIAEPPIIVTTSGEHEFPDPIIPHQDALFGVVPHGTNLATLLDAVPTIRVQDPTSAQALDLLHACTPQRILDVCAGRGTKTRQLRSLFPNAMIGATEPNDLRRTSLEEVAKEIDVTVYAPSSQGPSEPFDLVVVDTPCSNSGVFARRPEARFRYDQKHIDSLVDLQRTILTDANSILRHRGYLLYATCSVDHEENGAQVKWLTEKCKMNLVQENSTMPTGYPGSDPTAWRDGGFAALLQRR